jgi:hypothetical protein
LAAELVSAVNIYVSKGCPAAGVHPDGLCLQQAAAYVTRILAMFGLAEGVGDTLGFSSENPSTAVRDTQAVCSAFDAFVANVHSIAGSHNDAFDSIGLKAGALQGLDADASLDRLSKVRDEVKRVVQCSTQLKSVAAAIIAACDVLRDQELPKIGVKLEDRAGGAVWMRDDPAELLQEVCSFCR